ncbi:hypothetical protein PCE31106_02631 [Pandoraea cepalis]|uniref:Uncharacterized protein n=1 Tax=Pandoraea cepalis TaxID=2508294 RepID=A0A5E4VJN9_9BURK|nr:hypothetical protein PCE31106_02631 [Pandoraea cepalis]
MTLSSVRSALATPAKKKAPEGAVVLSVERSA